MLHLLHSHRYLPGLSYFNTFQYPNALPMCLFLCDSTLHSFMGNEYYNGIYIDPSALVLRNEFRDVNSHDISIQNIRRANNEVTPGIAAVSNFIGGKRYYIVRDKCPNCLKEKASYLKPYCQYQND